MNEVTFIVFILFAHFVADFVFQSRSMASNKSSCCYALSLHVAAYTVTIAVMVGTALLAQERLTDAFLTFVLFNAAAHWFTDFITSRASSYCYKGMTELPESQSHCKAERDNWEWQFWCVIGGDQLIHAATLILTYGWLLR